MKKGKYGLTYAFYTALAFALVILNQPLLCAAIALIAIFLEKDEWLSRQTLQAFLLSICSNFLMGALNIFTSSSIFYSYSFSFSAFSFLSFIIYVISVVFSVIGIIRTLKGREASIPIFANIAYKAFGREVPKYTYQTPQAPSNGYYNPQGNYTAQNGAYNPNMNNQPPMNQPSNAPNAPIPHQPFQAAPPQQRDQSPIPAQPNAEATSDKPIPEQSDSE